MTTRLLTKDEFLACFAEPMRDVTATEEAGPDIWAYVDAINLPLGRAWEVRDVAHVYRDARNQFEQVLIATDGEDLFLVVVVDLKARCVHGHHLLDLAAEYASS